jgi:hypothetical protein
MRKASAVWIIAILGFLIGSGLAAGHAQDAAPAKSSTEEKSSEHTEKPKHAYRLDFSLNELEDGKKINTRQYSLNENSDDSNEMKIGTRVPVDTNTKEGEFQYIDVGTTIWCQIRERSDGIALIVRAENSNFAIPEQGAGHDARPVIRQLKISGSTLALLGKPNIIGSMDDPNSKRQFQLEVTVTKLR